MRQSLDALFDQHFDAEFYLSQADIVLAAGQGPAAHFLTTGWRLGLSPCRWFDPLGYIAANPQVQASLVRSLSRAGYDAGDWGEIDEVLEEDYDTERVPVHEAILELVAKHKEVQAIPMLLRNIDEPSPTNVDVADNPPAEYWKARWHSWAVWKAKVKEALFEITGQRFSTAKEASIWIQRNKDKIGGKGKKKGKRRR